MCDERKNYLFFRYEGYVYSIVKRMTFYYKNRTYYSKKRKSYGVYNLKLLGMDKEDIFQEARKYLLEAIEKIDKFKGERKCHISTVIFCNIQNNLKNLYRKIKSANYPMLDDYEIELEDIKDSISDNFYSESFINLLDLEKNRMQKGKYKDKEFREIPLDYLNHNLKEYEDRGLTKSIFSNKQEVCSCVYMLGKNNIW